MWKSNDFLNFNVMTSKNFHFEKLAVIMINYFVQRFCFSNCLLLNLLYVLSYFKDNFIFVASVIQSSLNNLNSEVSDTLLSCPRGLLKFFLIMGNFMRVKSSNCIRNCAKKVAKNDGITTIVKDITHNSLYHAAIKQKWAALLQITIV